MTAKHLSSRLHEYKFHCKKRPGTLLICPKYIGHFFCKSSFVFDGSISQLKVAQNKLYIGHFKALQFFFLTRDAKIRVILWDPFAGELPEKKVGRKQCFRPQNCYKKGL